VSETYQFAAFYLEPSEGAAQDVLESRSQSAEIQISEIRSTDVGGTVSAIGTWGGIPVVANWHELNELGVFVIKLTPDLAPPLNAFERACERLSPLAAFVTSIPLADSKIHPTLLCYEHDISNGTIEPLYQEGFAALFMNRLDAALFDIESRVDGRRWWEVENGLVVLGPG
jgi:hypothetical protein